MLRVKHIYNFRLVYCISKEISCSPIRLTEKSREKFELYQDRSLSVLVIFNWLQDIEIVREKTGYWLQNFWGPLE